jgi:type IV secretory pathway VirB6-like protein
VCYLRSIIELFYRAVNQMLVLKCSNDILQKYSNLYYDMTTKYITLFEGKNLYLYYILFATIHYLAAVFMVYDRVRVTRDFLLLYEHAYSIVDIVYMLQ